MASYGVERNPVGYQVKHVSSSQPFTSATVANVTGMAVSVLAGHRYRLRVSSLVQSTAQTVGAAHALTFPAMTRWSANSDNHILTTDAQNGRWMGNVAVSGTAVVPTSISGANVDTLLTINAFFVPSAAGTIQLQLGVETITGSPTVTHEIGTMELWDFGTV